MTSIFYKMRRQDREMPEDFAYSVIDKARFGTMALMDETYTYSVPLSIARYENKLYFHSAKAGKKTELLENEPLVCISFVGDAKVPEIYTEEELEDIMSDPKKWSLLSKNVFTTEFESAIVYGKVCQVTDAEEIKLALRTIAQKYTPDKMKYIEQAISAGISHVRIYSVTIDHITGKRKKYDENGEEMKYGRGWNDAKENKG